MMILTWEYAYELSPMRDKNPKAEHSRIDESGVFPVLVRPNIFANLLGRYCCERTNTVRELM